MIQLKSFVYTQLNDQTIIFLTIWFNVSHLFPLSLNVKKFYLTIDRILSGATTPGRNWFGSNRNEEVLHIPQSSTDWSLTIRCFIFMNRALVGVGGCYLTAEMQSVYSTAPAEWVCHLSANVIIS